MFNCSSCIIISSWRTLSKALVWKKLREQGVKVVVFFGIDSRYRAFLSFLEERDNHGDFIFLASEEWATNKKILELSPLSARGSITLKVEEVDLEDVDTFRGHLANKRPSPQDTNIWFSEFWQYAFQCNLPGGFINTFGKLCEGKFPCPYLRLKASELTSMIRKQSRMAGSLNFPVFDQYGNGALGFDVYNVQKLDNGIYDYIKVGTFNSRSTPTFNKDLLKFYTDTGQVLDSVTVHCTS
ncbi:LOW QUALITY PROTEIN: metabotropic glutamate receptor 5, partial [Elysia marginata]